LRLLVRELSDALVSFNPADYAGAECAELARELARVANACTVGSARAAARASECKVLAVTPAEFLARTSGSTNASARAVLETIEVVGECPATEAALQAGAISPAQAAEIASVPAHEDELLEVARTSSLRAVKDRARKRRLAAIDAEELYATQRKAREFVHWIDDMGMVQWRGAAPPDVGIAYINQIEAEADRLWREARRNGGQIEPRAAYMADAVLAIASGDGKAKGQGRTDLVIVADLNAYRRGHAHDGEVSHIIGGGPIPIPVVRELAKDAFLKAVLHDGVAIHTVAHFGRKKPVHLMTTLELGAPPEFEGVTCAAEGCDRRYGLQWDHIDPVANGGMSSFENYQPLCGPSHWEKTERDRKAGLLRAPPKERAP
jgi:hypothetical protein